MCIRYFAFGALLFPLLGFASQDTLRVTIRQADSLLQIRSLDLVVQRYEINKAEAERIQARLFSNPQIGTEWAVNPPSGHFFDVGRNGEKAFTVEQLFQIAGQRSLAMKGAGKRVEMSTAEYAEFAAALRLRLHSALLEQFYSQRALDAISSQMALFHTVVDAYGGQYEKGNVSLKEVTRLRTTYFMLNDQRLDLRKKLNELQSDLRQLLAEERTVMAAPAPSELLPVLTIPPADSALVHLAEGNRSLLQAAQANVDAREFDLTLNRRMNVPDLTIGGTYDQRSGYVPNYTGLTVGFSLPIFDRGQGRISRAKAELDQARAQLGSSRVSVREEVLRASADLRMLQEQFAAVSPGFEEQLDQLSESLIGNYTKSNISLLEFTDLFESYNTSIITINAQKADLQNAYEELEFTTGQRLFAR